MSLDRLQKIDVKEPRWQALLKQLVEKICQAGPVVRIMVFGSFAAGKMTEASDIDLLVVIPDSDEPRPFRKRIPSPLSSWPTDLVIVTESRFNERKDFGGVIMEAWDGGIELYPDWKLGQ